MRDSDRDSSLSLDPQRSLTTATLSNSALMGTPEMSGLCQVPTPELGSCPAHSPRAVQGLESFSGTHTHTVHCSTGRGSLGSAAPARAWQGPQPCGCHPALPLPFPMARGMDTESSGHRSLSQPCIQGFHGDVTLWKLQEQLKVFVLTGFMSLLTHTGCQGLWNVPALQTLLTRSLDVPPWREEQPLCPGVRGHCWKRRWLCKGTAGAAPPWTLPHFCCSLFSSPGCYVGNILESKLGRRLKLSGPALGRCPCRMEMLLQSPAVSQQCLQSLDSHTAGLGTN